MNQHINIKADGNPLETFLGLFGLGLETFKGSIKVPDLPSNLARCETDSNPTKTSEITVRFYPSDTFLDFAATLLAGDFNLSAVKESGHASLHNESNKVNIK